MSVISRLFVITAVVVGSLQAFADSLKLSGTVINAQTGTPIALANVSVAGGQAVRDDITDKNGVFLLTLIGTVKRGDPIRLRVQKAGYDLYDEQISAGDLPLPVRLRPTIPSKPQRSTSGDSRRKPSTPPTPMFSEANDTFNISGGTISTTLHKGGSTCLVNVASGSCLVRGYVEDNKFFVDAVLFSGPGYGSVELKKNVLHKNIPEWDRCFNATALEVVDDQLTPVFQVRYTTPNDIVIYGLFRIGQMVYVLSPSGFGFHSAKEAIAQGEYPIKRIFSYPSRTSLCKETYSGEEGTKAPRTCPYRGMATDKFCSAVIDEATRISLLADQCLHNLENSASDDMRNQFRRSFSKKFMECCFQTVKDMHDELIFRLRPVVRSQDEHLLVEMEWENKHNPTGVILSTVEDISVYVRQLCDELESTESPVNRGSIVQQGRNNIVQGPGSTAIIEENPGRAFDKIQEQKFLGSIENANITPTPVFILAVSSDGDVDKFARQIETALKNAHWPVTYQRYGSIVDARNPYHADGIRCVSDTNNFTVEATAQALKDALKAAGNHALRMIITLTNTRSR